MRWQLLHQDGQKTYVLVFAVGDEVVSTLAEFVHAQGVGAASFTAIGAFSEATLGYFDWEAKEFQEIPVSEQVEVLTLAGDVALEEDEPRVHAHVVVGLRDGSARGVTCWRLVCAPHSSSCSSSRPPTCASDTIPRPVSRSSLRKTATRERQRVRRAQGRLPPDS